jgi:hypothetical protein
MPRGLQQRLSNMMEEFAAPRWEFVLNSTGRKNPLRHKSKLSASQGKKGDGFWAMVDNPMDYTANQAEFAPIKAARLAAEAARDAARLVATPTKHDSPKRIRALERIAVSMKKNYGKMQKGGGAVDATSGGSSKSISAKSIGDKKSRPDQSQLQPKELHMGDNVHATWMELASDGRLHQYPGIVVGLEPPLVRILWDEPFGTSRTSWVPRKHVCEPPSTVTSKRPSKKMRD